MPGNGSIGLHGLPLDHRLLDAASVRKVMESNYYNRKVSNIPYISIGIDPNRFIKNINYLLELNFIVEFILIFYFHQIWFEFWFNLFDRNDWFILLRFLVIVQFVVSVSRCCLCFLVLCVFFIDSEFHKYFNVFATLNTLT